MNAGLGELSKMRIKSNILILLIVILMLVACQSKKKVLVFIGEGENWTAEVTVRQTDGYEKNEIQLKYKGNDKEEIETFDYYVESSNAGAFGTNAASLNAKGVYQNKGLGSTSPSTREEDEFILKVEWNDKSERFLLRSK